MQKSPNMDRKNPKTFRVAILLQIERFQLKWFGHVSKIRQEQLPKQTFYADVNRERPGEQPRSRCLQYINDLSWNRLEHHPRETQSVSMDTRCDRLIWSCSTRNPPTKAHEEKKQKDF